MALGIDVKKQVFDIMLGMLGMRKKNSYHVRSLKSYLILTATGIIISSI